MPTTHELARVLADPDPPTADADARAAVARRSVTLVRRRRLAQGFGVVVSVVALAVGIAAVTGPAPTSRGAVHAATELPSDSAHAGVRLSVVPGDAVPAGVELDVELTGEPGTQQAHIRTPGTITLDGVAPGDYELQWSWATDDVTAAASGHVAVHVDHLDLTLTL